MSRDKKYRGIHAGMCKSLEKRLEKAGRYIYVDKNVEYHKNGLHGEVDVLTFESESQTYHFYEIKCNDTERNYMKAQDQYDRFCEAYPERKVKGIYITRQKIKRLR